MSVKIRLRRIGAKKATLYRIVVEDRRFHRDGRFIEEIGYYDPCHDPVTINIDAEKIKTWTASGAIVSDTVKSLIKKAGI